MLDLTELVMILDLHRQGLSVTAIARQAGVERKTVRKYIACVFRRSRTVIPGSSAYSDEAGRCSGLFRTFGAVPRAEQHNLRGLDHPPMQEIELSPTIHLPLDELESVDVALDRAGAPWFGQGGLHGVAVTLQSSCK